MGSIEHPADDDDHAEEEHSRKGKLAGAMAKNDPNHADEDDERDGDHYEEARIHTPTIPMRQSLVTRGARV